MAGGKGTTSSETKQIDSNTSYKIKYLDKGRE